MRSVTMMAELKIRLSASSMQIGHLVCRPADGVGFAGARGMLDQIVVAGAVPASVRHQPAHCVELLEAGKDQLLPHFR